MIWESHYWKEPLLLLADKLTQWQAPQEWEEEDLVGLEKDVFIAFYSIRKLIEARKLSDATAGMMVSNSAYPNKGKDVTILNWDKLEELYDFTSKKTEKRDLRFICNQVIHSYVFAPDISEEGILESILFCSDQERNKALYGIDRTELIRVFRIFGNDYPSSSTFTFNPDKRDYDVTNL